MDERMICEVCHTKEAVGSVTGVLVCRDCGPDATWDFMQLKFDELSRGEQ
jgi:hypothetical protein